LSCAGNHSSGFALTGSMAAQRRLHTATVLTDGSVLIAGGRNDTNPIHACGPSQNCVILGSAEIDNPLTKGFSGTGSLNNNRAGHTATRLNDGTVLVTGGSNVDSSGVEYALSTAETYSPISASFTSTCNPMNTARYAHTATLLNNGKVLIAGGIDSNNSYLKTAELYDPATRTFTPITPGMNAARARQKENGAVRQE